MLKKEYAPLVALLAAVVVTTVLFSPALNGPFLLDDVPNLSPMGADGGLDNAETFNRFVWGGQAGPLGRPLSLLSFTANAETWPADPFWFKATNIGIHLLIGVLLFVFMRMACGAAGLPKRNAGWIAFAVSAIWMVHPIHSASVFYVIQRMAQLSALFIVSGCIGWLHGRNLLLSGRDAKGYAWMSFSLIVFGGLGLLSKENAVVLPLVVLAMLITVAPVTGLRNPLPWRLWMGAFLLLPVAVIATRFALSFNAEGAFDSRSFSAFSRLMTQPIVLWDYVRLTLIPPVAPSVFNDGWDGYAASVPWLASLVASVAWLFVVTLAWRLRTTQPLIALAVFGFLGLHLLEAGPLSLEVYFLHRNYLASAFIVLAVVCAVLATPKRWRIAPAALGCVLVVVCIEVSRLSAQLWADEQALRAHWRAQAPDSLRAHKAGIVTDLMRANDDEAERSIDAAQEYFPQATSLAFYDLFLACERGQTGRREYQRLTHLAESSEMRSETGAALQQLARLVDGRGCLGRERERVLDLLSVFQNNPNYENREGMMRLLNAKYEILLAKGELEEALRVLDKQLEMSPNDRLWEKKAGLLVRSGQFEAAVDALQAAIEAEPYRALGTWFADDSHRRDRLKSEIARIKEKMQASS